MWSLGLQQLMLCSLFVPKILVVLLHGFVLIPVCQGQDNANVGIGHSPVLSVSVPIDPQTQVGEPSVPLLSSDALLPNSHEVVKGFFLLNYTNFNHGSFGAVPRPVLDYQTALRYQQEQQPDPFLRVRYKELWNATRCKIATSLQVPFQQLVLLESASTAVNSILRSLPWQEGVSSVSVVSHISFYHSMAYLCARFDIILSFCFAFHFFCFLGYHPLL
jgi:hypothetical protein